MSGKAKLSLEQIKAFNIAAVKFETQEGEKSLEDVDKIVNALSQINSTEIWNSPSPDISDLLFNCGQLIQVLDYKCGTTWNLIGLLYKIRDSSILSQVRKNKRKKPTSPAKRDRKETGKTRKKDSI